MAIRMQGTDLVLTGEWSIPGVMGQIDTMSNVLQEMNDLGLTSLRVDCGEIRKIDYEGLQVLNVWLQCARIRGMQPALVNLPEDLQRLMLVTGFAPEDTGFLCDAA